jgi:hypothetical protein
MVQRVTRSTCSSGFTNSGECDCTISVGLVLGSSSSKLHGLLGKLSEGTNRAEVGGKGFGHGGFPRVALAGRGEVAGAAGELGKVRRGAEEATGKMVVHEGGLYRGHGTCMGTGVADHARGRARQRPVRARPVRQGIEHVAAFVLVIFKHRLGHDLFVSIQNPCT